MRGRRSEGDGDLAMREAWGGRLWTDRGAEGLEWLRGLAPDKILVFDTETTGFDAKLDEVLQIGACDAAGNTVAYRLFGTERVESWPGAERVNGISPADVAGRESFREWAAGGRLQRAVDAADLLIAYNFAFDAGFLEAAGVDLSDKEVFDPMLEYAPVAGVLDELHGGFRWHRLAAVASHYGVGEFQAHDALGDALATARVFHALLDDRRYGEIVAAGGAAAPDVADLRVPSRVPPRGAR